MFDNSPIDEERDLENQAETNDFLNVIGHHKIIQLRNKFIPSGFVLLDKFFDNNDVVFKPKMKLDSKELQH